jgi:hypothetical protein
MSSPILFSHRLYICSAFYKLIAIQCLLDMACHTDLVGSDIPTLFKLFNVTRFHIAYENQPHDFEGSICIGHKFSS